MLCDTRKEPLLEVEECSRETSRIESDAHLRNHWLTRLDDYFEITARGSTFQAELRGGLAGFMTMSYILVVNPKILSVAAGKYGIEQAALTTATAVSGSVMSLLVGVFANVPFGVIPGMGLNAYLTYSVCLTLNVSWQQALSASFVGGAMLTLLCCLGVCDWVVQRVLPIHLKMSITVAIGMFQALIGLENMGIVVGASDTLVTLGDVAPTWDNAAVYIGVFGLLLIATLLIVAKWNGSMLIGIMFMACTSWVMKLTPAPVTMFNAPTWSSFCQIDFSGWNPARPEFPGLLVSSVVILFVCLFDVAGVQHGLQDACGLSDSPSRNTRIIGTTGIGTMIGAVLGTSPLLVAVESSSAIVEGARTGLASIVMAALFAVSMSISPVLDAMPRVATAVPLIVVGAFMMGPCGNIAWGNLRVALPAFLTITFVPFTYSIHNGVLAGLLMEMYLVGMGRTCGVTMDAEENDENVENGKYATPMHASPQSFYRLQKSSSCMTTPIASNLSTPRGKRK